MNTTNLIAIGRSRYLYDGIKHLLSKGYSFKAIVTEEAYEEYDIKHTDFECLANECGAAFFMVKSVNNEELVKIVKDNGIRVAISVNWKYTIPKSFLDLFECGILNFHLGNLPDYKGNATVNWTIINGESYINGNIHKMDPELDAGDDSYEVKGTLSGSRCYPRLPEDSQINWNQAAENVCRLVRASSHPYKGAFSFMNDEKIIIWRAKAVTPQDKFFAIPGHVVAVNKANNSVMVACTDGLLEVQEVERNGEVVAPTSFIKSIRVRFK
jgi:methionyl-tRNA formyltransferase